MILALLLSGCTAENVTPTRAPFAALPQLDRARNAVLSWPLPPNVDALAGAMPLRDGRPVAQPELAIARAILHTNPRIAQTYALLLAIDTAQAARARRLPPEFLGAALLQESAYDVEALSSAGAVGIAQFMPETADGLGVDPYDPAAAIAGAAELLGGYVAGYRGIYDDPYAAALAAYNAGPAAVQRYRGVPPYAETREYIALIFDRWARIAAYER
ncbi:MAG: transglycosylase SLT domain-containing protein [Candidatus Tumulicola sp.]